jgi:TonB family protein
MTVAGTGPSAPKAKAQTPSRIRIGGSVQAAKLVNQVRPIYPQQMKDQGIQGSVLLDAVIGVDGRIVNVEPVNSLVHPDLVQSAIDAVRQWEYEPTYLNGNPIEVQTSITINYTLAP